MPVYLIPSSNIFPHPLAASQEGILGVGGDLNPERLLLAYQFGIFPWYSEGEPIMWWSPNPRFVLVPGEVVVSKSMRPYFNQDKFKLTADQAFEEVIRNCQKVKRKDQMGTWITEDMVEAYIQLHQLGYAHSLEVWENNTLVGGLYGISLGKVFYGESMFSSTNNASKYAFISLCRKLEELGFWIIDCQQHNKHLESLGGKFMDGKGFHRLMQKNSFEESRVGSWNDLFNHEI